MRLERNLKIEYTIKGKYPEELKEDIALACFSSPTKSITEEEFIDATALDEDMAKYNINDFDFVCIIKTVKYGIVK